MLWFCVNDIMGCCHNQPKAKAIRSSTHPRIDKKNRACSVYGPEDEPLADQED